MDKKKNIAPEERASYGKGVNEVYKILKKTGHKNVTMKIYEGARHEILNEINRDEVYADIIAWLDRWLSCRRTACRASISRRKSVTQGS